ncbi:MAG TPA: ATP-dependent DNA ligase [Polyangia bacterium]
MLLAKLVETSKKVGATRSRLEKVAHLSAFLRELVGSPELLVGVAYVGGDLPQGRIGLGPALFRDLRAGAAAEATLTLAEVDRTFSAIKAESGVGSAGRRNQHLGNLLARATSDEQDFLLRLVIGEIRQGALEGVVVDAVSRAFAVEAAALRKAVMLAGALPAVVAAVAEAGPAGLARFELALFRPVQPMLADSADDVEAALGRLGEAAFESTLDGARVHVHKDGDDIEVYSRQQNKVTVAVPEIVERVRALPARRLVLDGEAIGFSPSGRPLPFQQTMRRFGRKVDLATLRQELPLSVYFFDALRIDDDTLIDRSLDERMEALASITQVTDRVPRIVTADVETANTFADEALARGHEGVMAKSLASAYSAGRRGSEWLKIKTAHTLDLVVLAAEWGSGRRKGWLSNLHLGARNPTAGGFVMLGKTFKGMTDEMLRYQTDALLAREIGRDPYTVYVRPELVVEVAFNDVQVSSQYPGGVALRFARIKRYRSDKDAAAADTIDQVRALLPQA